MPQRYRASDPTIESWANWGKIWPGSWFVATSLSVRPPRGSANAATPMRAGTMGLFPIFLNGAKAIPPERKIPIGGTVADDVHALPSRHPDSG